MENTIINDDCINFLQTLPDNSIDAIITDPPYFIDKLDEHWNQDKITNRKSNSHIKHLPIGMKFSREQGKKLYDYYLIVSKLLYKKLKPGGYFLSFICPRLYHNLTCAVEDTGFEIREQINWIYTQNMPKGMTILHLIDKNKNLSNEEKELLKEKYKNFKTPMIKSNCEPICVAMKPIEKTFLNNEIKYNTGLINFDVKIGINNDHVISNIMTTEEFHEIYDKNFLIPKPSKKEKGDFNFHISVKPIQILEHLINIFTKEGGIVLDPFSGSGSIGIACKNLNRKYILVEKSKEYIDIIKKRLE